MKNRAARAVLSLGLVLSLTGALAAQVRPVLMPSMGLVAGAPAAAVARAIFAMPALTAAPALTVVPSLAMPAPLAPAPAPGLAFAPAAALSAKAPSAAAASLTALRAAPATAGVVFDGAAIKSPASLSAPVSAPDAAPAPRGDTLKFNGQTLPTRMFSDQTQISSHLIRAIDATKKTLDIAIYELAIREVHDALKRAKDRGVRVRVVIDQGHVYPEKPGVERTAEVSALIADGFSIKTLRGADEHGIMHNKFAVFDGALLETGSYNWSHAADTMHFENALFDGQAARIASYQRYWDWLWAMGRPVDLAHPPEKVVLDENKKTPPLPPAPQDAATPVAFNGINFPSESFTPYGTAAQVAAAIKASKTGVDLANFSFTNTEIVAALKSAKDRLGAKNVRLIFDRSQYGFLKVMSEMAALGFDVRLSDGKTGEGSVMHNKFGVFDGKLVETGSFNWTNAGEFTNFENAVFLNAPDDAAGFEGYFQRIWNQAQAPTPADQSAPPAPEGPQKQARPHQPSNPSVPSMAS